MNKVRFLFYSSILLISLAASEAMNESLLKSLFLVYISARLGEYLMVISVIFSEKAKSASRDMIDRALKAFKK